MKWGGDNQNWALHHLDTEERAGSISYLTDEKETACLKVLSRSDVWLAENVGPEAHWGAHTEFWLRKIPGWDDGRNWVTSDGNDWSAGGGTHIDELMKNGYLRTDDGPPRIVGDRLVAYDR